MFETLKGFFMGDPVPGEWPGGLEDDKWYCVTVEAYQHPVSPGCVGVPHIVKCCKTGAMIKAFDAYECINGIELCTFSGFSAQHVVSHDGPYDTADDCYGPCLG